MGDPAAETARVIFADEGLRGVALTRRGVRLIERDLPKRGRRYVVEVRRASPPGTVQS